MVGHSQSRDSTDRLPKRQIRVVSIPHSGPTLDTRSNGPPGSRVLNSVAVGVRALGRLAQNSSVVQCFFFFSRGILADVNAMREGFTFDAPSDGTANSLFATYRVYSLRTSGTRSALQAAWRRGRVCQRFVFLNCITSVGLVRRCTLFADAVQPGAVLFGRRVRNIYTNDPKNKKSFLSFRT